MYLNHVCPRVKLLVGLPVLLTVKKAPTSVSTKPNMSVCLLVCLSVSISNFT